MANNDQNDKELNDYLNGNSDVSKAYRASNTEKPPAHLDDAILSAAQEAINISKDKQNSKQKFHKSPWVKPISIAAMITLSVSLVVTMQQDAGRPLISETEVEMFDSVELLEEKLMPQTVDAEDGASVLDEVEMKQNKDERLDATEPATLGAIKESRVKRTLEAPMEKMRERAAKKVLLKEKAQIQTETVEKDVFAGGRATPSAAAEMKFDDMVDTEQERHITPQEDILLKIKAMWEQGELASAKEAYEEFTRNHPNYSSESIKEILGDNIYNGLLGL
jgi:hypothetical protein